MTEFDLDLPDTDASRAALEVATRYSSTGLLNHCLRSYHWGATYARARRIEFDDELYFVASMLHDLALVPAFDHHTASFEHAGADLAWLFGAGAGWPLARREHAGRIIIDHMGDADIDPDVDAESHLLFIATGHDISGRRTEEWAAALKEAVVARYPRLDLGSEFVACFEDQATRKPASSAASALASGMAQRVANNPLDAL